MVKCETTVNYDLSYFSILKSILVLCPVEEVGG